MLDFIRIHAIKKDLLTKRQCIYDQKLSLMAYRTSLANYLEPRPVDQIKLNEEQLLNYAYRLGQHIERLNDVERDLNFELDLLKVANQDHLRALESLHKNDNTNKLDSDVHIGYSEPNLNSYEFFNRMKNYNFKTKFKGFFQSFLIKKENEYLLRLNKDLENKLQTNE